MADVLVIYNIATDITGDATGNRVKEAMKLLGYKDCFKGKGADGNPIVQYLPANCFGKSNTTPAQAKADLLNAATECNAVVARLVATEFETWDAIPGREVI